MPRLVCESCGEGFRARRVTARFCGPTCRSRAHRAKPPERLAPVTQFPAPEHLRSELARTVYEKLTETGRIDTIPGQQALDIALNLASPHLSTASRASLHVQLSRVVDIALAGTTKSDSRLDELRAIRDRKRAATSQTAVP